MTAADPVGGTHTWWATRAEAKAIGLVNHLVPAGQARAKALEIATTIAATATATNR